MAEMRDRSQGLALGAERSAKASRKRIVALLASHNRCAETLACLSSYFAQNVGPDVSLSAVVVDDGSDDGTAAAVQERFPNTHVIIGRGDLFWARSMAIAEEAARTYDPDYLLWLNDDVILDEGAVRNLMDTVVRASSNGCIVAGAVRDPVTGKVTYSGVRRSRVHPLRVVLIPPTERPVEIDTFDGNVVLVPRAACERVGGIDGEFEHASADHDYGLRAAKAGVPRLLAPGTVGTCVFNRCEEPWADPTLTVRERFQVLVSSKGHPPRSRARYLRRHGGPVWPLFWLAPYIRALPSLLRRDLHRI
jgi:GT2 family glycosyltransferase